jgi:hypothetical protein
MKLGALALGAAAAGPRRGGRGAAALTRADRLTTRSWQPLDARATVSDVLHLSRAPQGGLALGIGAFGTAVWAQREPRCHRWHVWRTQAPREVGPCGDDWGFWNGRGSRASPPTPRLR